MSTRQDSSAQAKYYHLPELDNVELLEAAYCNKYFDRHVHEGYVIGVIETGAQGFYRNGVDHVAGSGSIILVNADEVHTGYSANGDAWTYQAMYPTVESLRDLSETIGKPFVPYFLEPVVEDPFLVAKLRQMWQLLKQSPDRLERETGYLETMVLLLKRHGRYAYDCEMRGRPGNHVVSIKRHIKEHHANNISLDELAELTGLNQHYLIRMFKKVTGITPHQWQIQCRVSAAQKLIKSGKSVSYVASFCGFADQSHLTKHFKRVLGTTPVQYASRSNSSLAV